MEPGGELYGGGVPGVVGEVVDAAQDGEEVVGGVVAALRLGPAAQEVVGVPVVRRGAGAAGRPSRAWWTVRAQRRRSSSWAGCGVGGAVMGPILQARRAAGAAPSPAARSGAAASRPAPGPSGPSPPTWIPGRRSGSGSWLRMISRVTGAVSPRPSRK
ncbi:hypothetical protein [Streptomyces somaliensis]|uniref:hypothetical protein n=1 Tax=Streptomyces somaliensis TaxID=78355 RepID=UPI003F7544EB